MLPSNKITFTDVPEVLNFSGLFNYNFFVRDEAVNDSGFPNTAQSRLPRYISLNWNSVFIPENINTRQDIVDAISVEENYSKIISEQDFGRVQSSIFSLQDTNVDSKLLFFANKAKEILIPTSSVSSTNEQARNLNSVTSPSVTLRFLNSSLYNPASLGISFAGDQNIEELKKLSEVKTQISFNKKFLSNFIDSIAKDPSCFLADEAEALSDSVRAVQSLSRNQNNSNNLAIQDFQNVVEKYISISLIDNFNQQNDQEPVYPIGYVIEKHVATNHGDTSFVKRFFIEDPRINNYLDTEIKYGEKYFYKIRSVYRLSLKALEETQSPIKRMFKVVMIVGSSWSNFIKINCIECEPPPPPSDLSLSWDQEKRCCRILWSFPINHQRDIKKFQLFRRSSVNEPFELIKMFDFDDSVVKTTNYHETPDAQLIQTQLNPSCFYLDTDFSFDQSGMQFIYALCSIDAHGYSSGYSCQVQAYFDKFQNKLNTKLLSVSGAPKAYPNIYLPADNVFVDAIKTEGYSKLSVFFNPEYTQVTDIENNDLKLLKTQADDKYILQIINTDLNQQKVLNINLTNIITRISV
jgi:hypothetical protein